MIVYLSLIDPSLGRLDYASLTDQARMEIVIESLPEESKERFRDDSGSYRDVCEWRGVECDDEHNAIKFSTFNFLQRLEGTLNFCFLPPCAIDLCVIWMGISGTLDIAKLPPHLKSFDVNTNELSGTLDLDCLPSSLVDFNVSSNDFSGSCSLTKLPSSLVELVLCRNKLSGSVNLTSLPKTLGYLSLACNQLCGEIKLENLPEALRYLDLDNNPLEGKLTLLSPPQDLQRLTLEGAKLEEVAVVAKQCTAHLLLLNSGVKAVHDESGLAHPLQLNALNSFYSSDEEQFCHEDANAY